MGMQLRSHQGIWAGIFAGAGMIIAWMLFAQLLGSGADQLIDTIAATVLGQDTAVAGWQPVTTLVGLGLHLLIAIVLGLLFAVSMDRLKRRDTLLVSTFYGFTIWFVASFLLSGWLQPAIQPFCRTWWGLAVHLLFGFLLGVYAVRFGTPPPVLSPD